MGGVPSVGVFLRDPSPYLGEFPSICRRLGTICHEFMPALIIYEKRKFRGSLNIKTSSNLKISSINSQFRLHISVLLNILPSDAKFNDVRGE